jgi:hypothetical protein
MGKSNAGEKFAEIRLRPAKIPIRRFDITMWSASAKGRVAGRARWIFT